MLYSSQQRNNQCVLVMLRDRLLDMYAVIENTEHLGWGSVS